MERKYSPPQRFVLQIQKVPVNTEGKNTNGQKNDFAEESRAKV